MKNCTPLWREATFASEKAKITSRSDHFWKLRCRKSAPPLWREAHFEVKMYKTRHVRTTFTSCDVEKVHAVVARSTFRSQMYKTRYVRTTFRSCDVEKVHAVVARSTFRSQNVQNTPRSDHFWKFRARFAWQAQGIVHLVKSEQSVRVLWHFQKGWQAWDI